EILESVSTIRSQRTAANGPRSPRQLLRSGAQLGAPAGVVSLLLLRGRLARADLRLCGSGARAPGDVRCGCGLDRRRSRSGALHDLRAVGSEGACRAASPPFDGDAAAVARARADLQGSAGAVDGEGSQYLRMSGVSAPA